MGIPNFAGFIREGVICPKRPSHFQACCATHCFWKKNMSLKGTKSSTGNFVNCVTFWFNISFKHTDTEIHSINKTKVFVGFRIKNTLHRVLHVILLCFWAFMIYCIVTRCTSVSMSESVQVLYQTMKSLSLFSRNFKVLTSDHMSWLKESLF